MTNTIYFKHFLFLYIILIVINCSGIHAQSFEEIDFDPIELNTNNVNEFPFLQKYKNENDEFKKQWQASYQTDLTLPDKFPAIKIKIAKNVTFNNQVYNILYIEGGYGQYCPNIGCTINFYKNNSYVGGFYSGGVMPKILSCSKKDFIVSGFGPGMDISFPGKGIVKGKLKTLYQTKDKNAYKICNKISEEN